MHKLGLGQSVLGVIVKGEISYESITGVKEKTLLFLGAIFHCNRKQERQTTSFLPNM